MRARAVKKLLLTVFFDSVGILVMDFRNCTINTKLYCKILTKLRAAVRKKRPMLWELDDHDGEQRF